MSIPKEPRQLMINLMYLVLTALLALNVSAEILNAFNLVNKGIGNTNTILSDKNSQIIAGIADKAAEEQTDRVQQINQDAMAVQKLTSEFYNYIEGIKNELIEYTGGTITDKHSGLEKLKGESDTEKPTTMFINRGKGAELKAEILKVSEEYKNILNKWNGEAKASQLTLSIDESDAQANKLTWEEFNFYKVPTIAVITILTKIQNDSKSTESTVLEHLASQVDAAKIKFDKMAARVIAPSSYVKRGNEYTADIFIAATSEQANIEVFLGTFTSAVHQDANGDYNVIKGKDIPLSGARQIEVVGGMGKIKELATGSPKYQGVIRLPDPVKEGEYQFYPFDFGYETFEVGQAVISPTAMNVLYIGVDNPVKISVPGFAADKVSASGCGIAKVKGEEYIAKPTTVGLDKINVTVQSPEGSKTYSEEFRVRRIPDPYPYCGSSKGGTMKAGEFKITDKIDARNPDFVFQIPYTVSGFEMVYAPSGGGNIVSDVSSSNKFTLLMNEIKKKAKPGDTIVFPRISVRMPDGTTRQLSLSFKLIG